MLLNCPRLVGVFLFCFCFSIAEHCGPNPAKHSKHMINFKYVTSFNRTVNRVTVLAGSVSEVFLSTVPPGREGPPRKLKCMRFLSLGESETVPAAGVELSLYPHLGINRYTVKLNLCQCHNSRNAAWLCHC